jgi:hypothetical protein
VKNPTRMLGGRNRLFPATSEEAVLHFPPLVLSMIRGTSRCIPFEDSVLVESSEFSLRILLSDFSLLSNVARKLSPNPRFFPSEPDELVLARIRSFLQVEFSHGD